MGGQSPANIQTRFVAYESDSDEYVVALTAAKAQGAGGDWNMARATTVDATSGMVTISHAAMSATAIRISR